MNENSTNPSILGMIFSPGEQFERIRTKPKVWLPLLIVLIASLVAGWLMVMSPDFEATMNEGMNGAENMGGALIFIKVFTALSIGISPIFGVLIGSFIYWLISKATPSEVTFKQLFSMNLFITFISAIGLVLNGLLMALLGGEPGTMYTSIGSLMSAEGASAGVWNSLEIFNIWATILTIIGLRITAGWPKALAWIIPIVFFLIGIGFAAIGTMFNSMSGM
ncbi:YIP1 family protein [Guptibacillus algicola]|uniref:YIP1 family protein n=1 Tax=Guptibacillus algicola TaxID=225844 RepID=UPI001CD802EC|nr:YIP1 family protein [Alkalihalobacillus algicola]MCA0987651.1 YIP1 family protein [Alkalihalobacillus algicola]